MNLLSVCVSVDLMHKCVFDMCMIEINFDVNIFLYITSRSLIANACRLVSRLAVYIILFFAKIYVTIIIFFYHLSAISSCCCAATSSRSPFIVN